MRGVFALQAARRLRQLDSDMPVRPGLPKGIALRPPWRSSSRASAQRGRFAYNPQGGEGFTRRKATLVGATWPGRFSESSMT